MYCNRYVLLKACHTGDGSLDWSWAEGLVEDKLRTLTDEATTEARVQAEVALRLAQAQAAQPPAAANADVDI